VAGSARAGLPVDVPMTRSIRAGELCLALTMSVLAPSAALAAHGGDAPTRGDPLLGVDSAQPGIATGLLLREMESAYRHEDLAAAAALIDFPLVVDVTGSDGRMLDASLGAEEWLAAMEPRFNGRDRRPDPPRAAGMADPLAWIEGDRKLIARPDSMEARRRSLVMVRRGRRWLIKAIVGRSWPGPDGLPGLVGPVATMSSPDPRSTR
jgi:hypothetical protein